MARLRSRPLLLACLFVSLLLLARGSLRAGIVDEIESHTTGWQRKRPHSARLTGVNASFLFEDGLLFSRLLPSDVRALHPIHHLLAKAKADWFAKLGRQSKTLAEATREYTRRYGRKPPPGFDDWFKFAQRNKVGPVRPSHGQAEPSQVILIDEYDQIERDVLPLRGLPAAVLRDRAGKLVSEYVGVRPAGSC